MFSILFLLLLQISAVLSNTEKVIFLGPTSLNVPVEHPTIEDLKLEALSPLSWSLRTHIQAEFPTNSSAYGQSSWFLLHRLQEGRRYEVRICWAATQPTSFRMDTYDLPTVFETPELVTSLADFSNERQMDALEVSEPSIAKRQSFKHSYDDVSSTLFLHVYAAADYYTTNKTLMEQVPPVYVDIILDPFLLNVFPRSLVPTASYIILLAVGSWFLSKYISRYLRAVGNSIMDTEKKTS